MKVQRETGCGIFFMFWIVLQVVLICLRASQTIMIPWWVVFIPIWGPVALFTLAFLITLIVVFIKDEK